jgi:chorismate mutase
MIAGKFVSESKFMSDPAAFIPHIQNPNRAALEALITKPEVERKLLLRLQKKAATYAQDFGPDGEAMVSQGGNALSSNAAVATKVNGAGKIDVDGVVDLYESYIIPLTKEVEVSLESTTRCWIEVYMSFWLTPLRSYRLIIYFDV